MSEVLARGLSALYQRHLQVADSLKEKKKQNITFEPSRKPQVGKRKRGDPAPLGPPIEDQEEPSLLSPNYDCYYFNSLSDKLERYKGSQMSGTLDLSLLRGDDGTPAPLLPYPHMKWLLWWCLSPAHGGAPAGAFKIVEQVTEFSFRSLHIFCCVDIV